MKRNPADSARVSLAANAICKALVAHLIKFLQSGMSYQQRVDLITSLGYREHGKKKWHWVLLDYIASAGGKFQVAPGVLGNVMSVFTLPSYDLVFKIFRDAFADRDNPDRRAIMQKYNLVAKYDKAGRLVDAQQIENLTFARRYFADMLLTELARVATRTIIIDSDHVIIKHAIVEPRLTPLDIYLREVDQITASAAVEEYGNAIKDLAASNIFPGDLLQRNFGVTREGRVLLYDYDKLCLLTDCKVSQMPEARDDIEEFAD